MNFSKVDFLSGSEHSSSSVAVVGKESAAPSKTTSTVTKHPESTERTSFGKFKKIWEKL